MNKNKNYGKREKILNEIMHTANSNATEKQTLSELFFPCCYFYYQFFVVR